MTQMTSAPTGIDELDALLGMEGEDFPDNALVLIRGGPAAGKTTLALQILDRQLRRQDVISFALFISLEQDPHSVLKRARASFNLELDQSFASEQGSSKPQRMLCFDKTLLRNLLDEIEQHDGPPPERSAEREDNEQRERFLSVLEWFVVSIKDSFDPDNPRIKRLWLLVDSLNVFGDMSGLKQAFGHSREALGRVVPYLQAVLTKYDCQCSVVAIYTEEYRSGLDRSGSFAAESFFC